MLPSPICSTSTRGELNPFDPNAVGAEIDSDTDKTYSVAVGDMDGDGNLDIITGNYGANKLYLSNGDGTFAVGTAIGSNDTDNTTSMVLGDVDGDGHLDLVVGNEGEGNKNKLYLNEGDADPFSDITNGTTIGSKDTDNTTSMVLGDVDGDGHLDILAGNSGQTNKLYLNEYNPLFANGWIASDIGRDFFDYTYSAVVADVDKDGNLDVIVGNYGQTNKLYLSNGDSTFAASSNISNDRDNTYSVAVADVDKDGNLDVIVGNYGQTNKLYLGNGDGTFAASSNISNDTGDTYSVALGDVDEDGRLDIIVGNYSYQFNKLYLGNGDGTFASGTAIGNDTNNTLSVALGDMNNDGHLDIILGDKDSTNKLYLGDGSGVFPPASGSQIGSDRDKTYSVAVADVDEDSDLDIIVGNEDQSSKLYLNEFNEGGTFSAGIAIGSDTDDTYSVAVIDVDEDGHLDIVTGNGRINKLYLGNGDSTFASGTAIGNEADYTQSVVVADMNGDGDLDIVTGNYSFVSTLYRRNYGPKDPYYGVSYNTTAGTVTSTSISTDEVSNVLIKSTEIISPNTHIDYWVTNNGGTKWYLAQPGTRFIFPTSGSDLRWRVVLHSLSPVRTPRIEELTLSTDTTAPMVTANNLATNDATPMLSGTVDDNTATIKVTVDGTEYIATNNSDGTWTLADGTLPELAEGSYNITVMATDSLGNEGSTTVNSSLTIDTTNPTVIVNTLTTNDLTPELSGTVSDATAVTVKVTVNSKTYNATVAEDGNWTMTIPDGDELDEGSHDITVVTTDAAGNVTTETESGSLTIDVTAPTVTANDLTTNNATPTLSGTVDDNTATIKVTVDGTEYIATNNSDGTWTLADGTLPELVEGSYNITVTATDSLGNEGSTTVNSGLTIDTTNPTVIVNTLITNDPTPELSGTVSDATAVMVKVMVNSKTYNATVAEDGSWTVTIPDGDELDEGSHDITVVTTDAAGNVTTETESDGLTIDTTAPTATSTPTNIAPAATSMPTDVAVTTPTATVILTDTPTSTPTDVAVTTPTATVILTDTPTSTPTDVAVTTPTATVILTDTPTSTPTDVAVTTPMATGTPTSTPTDVAVTTPTATSTPTDIATNTPTATVIPTTTVEPTATPPPILAPADLFIKKEIMRSNLSPEGYAEYHIYYGNQGGAAENVRIADTLPMSTTYLANRIGQLNKHEVTVEQTGQNTIWTIPALQPGEHGSILLRVSINKDTATDTELVNTAIISSGNADSDPDNNTATHTSVVKAPFVDLTIDKVDVSQAFVGGTLHYRIGYSNVGTTSARDITIEDTLPDGVTVLRASDGGIVNGNVVTWNVGQQVGLLDLVVQISDTLKADTTLINQVEISSSEADSDASNNLSTVTTTVNGQMGSISGTVTDPDGNPLAKARVSAYRSIAGVWLWSGGASSDANGQYTIPQLVAGTYRVGFLAPKLLYPREFHDDAKAIGDASDITVDGDITGIDVQFNAPAPPKASGEMAGGWVVNDPETGDLILVTFPDKISDLTVSHQPMCQEDTPNDVTLHLTALNGTTVDFPMADMGNGQYQAVIPASSLTSGHLSLSYLCESTQLLAFFSGTSEGRVTEEIGKVTVIDPSGTITDAATGKAISDAEVTLYTLPSWTPKTSASDGGAETCHTTLTKDPTVAWNDMDAAPEADGQPADPDSEPQQIDPQLNPQTTDTDGQYGWNVAEGCWFVTVEADDYDRRVSPAVGMPPEVTDLDLALVPENTATVQFESSSTTVDEGKSASLVMTLSEAVESSVTVDYTTVDGWATADSDYTAASGTVMFAAGETSQTISVSTADDSDVEQDEGLTVVLSNVTNATLGSPKEMSITIVDNDATTVPPSGVQELFLPVIAQ